MWLCSFSGKSWSARYVLKVGQKNCHMKSLSPIFSHDPGAVSLALGSHRKAASLQIDRNWKRITANWRNDLPEMNFSHYRRTGAAFLYDQIASNSGKDGQTDFTTGLFTASKMVDGL